VQHQVTASIIILHKSNNCITMIHAKYEYIFTYKKQHIPLNCYFRYSTLPAETECRRIHIVSSICPRVNVYKCKQWCHGFFPKLGLVHSSHPLSHLPFCLPFLSASFSLPLQNSARHSGKHRTWSEAEHRRRHIGSQILAGDDVHSITNFSP